VVIEGCGSPVEMNIRDRDLANLWLAEAADSPCLVVADIERCGVFASLLGTLDLMADKERNRVRGFIVNKFHGSIDDFRDGIEFLEQRAGVPCLGVIPRLIPLRFPAEDSIDLSESRHNAAGQEAALRSVSDVYSTEIDRWTNHVFAYCDAEQLLGLFGTLR
jgi:adenosylcobyric acid synthase